jgi:predicted lipoprotein with Yx(FWY)xxD motif
MRTHLLLLAPALAATLAACGTTNGTAEGGSGGAAASASGAVLSAATTSLGPILVDANGFTVYMLTSDSRGHATCDAQCLNYWPAVSAKSAPAHVAGVSAPIGSTALPGGGTTLTAGGLPLYTFIKDKSPGDVSGQGVKEFGGVWYAVSPSGKPVRSAPGPGSSASSSPAGGGYAGGY